MEPKISNLQSEINNKQKRKLFGRSDRFLRQDFGKDIAKKIKSISNSENPASLITSNSEIGKKTEFEPFIEEKQLQKVLKNKRYEIKFGDLRVETFINSLKLSDQQNFLSVPRKPCPLCKRNSCLYCPECLQPVIYESLIPKVLLPIQLTLYLF